MSVAQTKNGLVDLDRPAEEDQTVRGMIDNAKCASERCVTDHPVASTLVALGAGALVGLLAAATMSRNETRRRENYFSRMGSQIASSIGGSIPDSFNWKR